MTQPKNLDPTSMAEFYGAELRRRREGAGLSQDGLGELVYCSGAYIGMVEMAGRRPQLDLSEQIDRVLKADGFFRRLCEAILKASKFASYFAAAAELERRALHCLRLRLDGRARAAPDPGLHAGPHAVRPAASRPGGDRAARRAYGRSGRVPC